MLAKGEAQSSLILYIVIKLAPSPTDIRMLLIVLKRVPMFELAITFAVVQLVTCLVYSWQYRDITISYELQGHEISWQCAPTKLYPGQECRVDMGLRATSILSHQLLADFVDSPIHTGIRVGFQNVKSHNTNSQNVYSYYVSYQENQLYYKRCFWLNYSSIYYNNTKSNNIQYPLEYLCKCMEHFQLPPWLSSSSLPKSLLL